MNRKKIKIGLLIDSYLVSSWVYELIRDIVHSNHSEVALIVKNQNIRTKESQSILKRIWKKRNEFIYNFYDFLERKFIGTPDKNAFELKNIKDLIDDNISIEIQPIKTEYSDYFSEKDISKIEDFEIDLFIRLGFRILRGKILKLPRYGIWSYHHGDNRINRGGPPAVWETLEQWPYLGVVLQILSEDLDAGFKLYESFSEVHRFSVFRSKNAMYWKAKSFINRELEYLYENGWERFIEKNQKKFNSTPQFYSNELFKKPNTISTLKGVGTNFLNYIIGKFNRLFFINQWVLLYKFNDNEIISQTFYRFNRILPPKDRFWADPFPLYHDEKYYIFFEEFVYSENKGKICFFQIDPSGYHTEPSVVVEKDYHLSYPFIFEDKGTYYMIPETSNNNTIEIYECIDFPSKWEFKKVLINNIEALDSTIFKHNGKYWLYSNLRENPGASKHDELFLFSSDSLLDGEWVSHPDNPIISDVRCARPAGNIFKFNNKYFRPAQNCSRHYGFGIQIREISKLNESEYQENQVQSIFPNWQKDLISTHTLNHSSKLTVIDAEIKRWRF